MVALLIVLLMYREPAARSYAGEADQGRFSFRGVLRFEGFLLMMGVIFGIQFAERSFGPLLPLYVARLGVPLSHVPLWSGVLFSLVAGMGALGNHVCGRLLQVGTERTVILGSGAVAAGGAALVAGATDIAWLLMAMPIFGLAAGTGMTAAYTAAGRRMPAGAHGVGFGFLSSASLAGLALSPVLSGLLGAVSLRAVFALDAVGLGVLSVIVRWAMAEPPKGASPADVQGI